MRALAGRVADQLPDWSVAGATLAGPGALETALQAVPGRGLLVYPLFMADGWFVRLKLPQRLRQAGRTAFDVLPPLGLHPDLPAICHAYLRRAVAAAGLRERQTTVLLAAHGSPSDPRPRQVAEQAADSIGKTGVFREVRTGLLEEAPFLADAARLDGPAVCLPFFAGRAGHVNSDLPAALAQASFPGPVLDPIGLRPEVAGIVAAALTARVAQKAA